MKYKRKLYQDGGCKSCKKKIKKYQNAGNKKSKWSASNIGHGILDVAGMFPVIGEPADLINAGWYAAEGDKTNAALSMAGVIPFAGWGATLGKWGLKAKKASKAQNWSKGPSYYKGAGAEGLTTQVGGMAAQGKWLDDMGYDVTKHLDGKNIKYIGDPTNSGRVVVEVALPNGKTQLFYKSSGGGQKVGQGVGGTTEDMWQPFMGYSDQVPTGWKQNKAGDWVVTDVAKAEKWHVKSPGYENFYGSKSYRDIAGNLDRISVEQGWDMSPQKYKSKGDFNTKQNMGGKRFTKRKRGGIRKYQNAGMYGDNTIAAAGQAGAGSTANIVFNESNPQVLQNKLDFLKSQKDKAISDSEAMAIAIEEQKSQDELAIQEAATKESKLSAAGKLVKGTYDMMGDEAKKSLSTGLKEAGKKIFGSGTKTASSALPPGYKLGDFTKYGKDAFKISSTPTLGTSPTLTAGKSGTSLLGQTSSLPGTAGTGLTSGTTLGAGTAGSIGTSGSTLGTGLGSASTTLGGTTLGGNIGSSIGGTLGSTGSGLGTTLGGSSALGTTLGGSGTSLGSGLGSSSLSSSLNVSPTLGTNFGASGAGFTNKLSTPGLLGSAGAAAGTGTGIASKGLMATTGFGTTGAAGATGLSKFATSGAGIGTIASLAGMGVSALSDDQDPTKLNFGEGAGATLSGIGTGIGAAAGIGAAMGTAVPLVGNIIGAGLGAAYGLGSALIGRNKARDQKAKLENDRRAKVAAHNQKVTQNLISAQAQARAGEIEQKTYSGYDLGRNVVAQMGGMRLGVPRY